jgi:uncharacterized repeat protein (TIGR01451 family)
MLKQQPPSYSHASPQRNWLRFCSTLLPLFGSVVCSLLTSSAAHALTGGVTITSITPFAPLDSNNSCGAGPRAMYLQVDVKNTTGGTLTGLSASINSFTNSAFILDAGESPVRYIGSLAANQTTSLYWYVNYPCTGSFPQSGFGPVTNYTVTLSDSTPGTVTSSSFALTTRSEASASAGGDIANALIGAGAVPGQIIPYTVNYNFGNPASVADVIIQPAGNVSFDSSCFRLISTDITASNFTAGPLTTNDNRLYFTGVNGGSSNALRVVYSFMSLCDSAGTIAKPFADLTSGGPQKYTSNYETFIGASFPTSTNPFTITKSASPATLPTGGIVTYTVTITNPSSYNAIIDRITDTLPTNVTYGALVTGPGNTSTTIIDGSTSQPSAGTTGTINWLGNPNTSYSLPAGGSITLKYTANVPNVVGSYTNSVTTTAGSSTTTPVTATVSVGISDLTLTKTHTGNLTVGIPGIYALTANNIGTASTTGTTTIVDTLPPGLTIPNGSVTLTGTNAANWSCSATNNVITCTSNTAIAVSGNSTFNLTGIQVGASALGSVTNIAVVSGGGEVNVLNNSASDVTTVVAPDLTLSKTHTGNFTVGTPASYTLSVQNVGAAATSGTVTVTDTLPAGLTLPNGTVTLTGTNALNWNCNTSNNVITCTSNTAIAAGNNSTFTLTGIQVGAAAIPTVTNNATVAGGNDVNTTNNAATDPTIVNGISDLTLTKSHTGNFTVGTLGTYALTVNNIGSAATTGAITMTDILPTGLTIPNGAVTLTGTNAANWSCTASGNIITCTSSTAIASGGNSTFNLTGIQVGVTAVPSVTNTANISGGGEANTSNDSASDVTTVVDVVPDVTLMKTHTGNLTVGDPASYSLTVNNIGIAPTMGTITISDTLPTGLTIPDGSITITGTDALNWTCTTSNNVITCISTTVIAANGNSTFNLTGIQVGATAVGSVTNTATVSGGGETNTANNSASDLTTVNGGPQPNVLLVKRITAINGANLNVYKDDTDNTMLHAADDNDINWPTPLNANTTLGDTTISTFLRGAIDGGKVKPGDTIEYTIYFLNAGGSNASNLRVCDRIIDSQKFLSGSTIQLQKNSATPTALTSGAGDDRATLYSSSSDPAITNCNFTGTPTIDNGAIVVDVTGTTGNPTWITLPGSTGAGTTDTYGFVRFTTKINP